jgi:hypothetical protein
MFTLSAISGAGTAYPSGESTILPLTSYPSGESTILPLPSYPSGESTILPLLF